VHIVRILFFGFALLTIFSNGALAGISESKGMGDVVYDGRGGPSTEDRSGALQKAMVSAIERHAANAGTAKFKNYERVKSEIINNINDFIIDHVILSEKTDEDAKRYKVVIRASINDTRLNAILDGNSAVSNTASDERSYITFVFVARAQTSVQSYRDKEFLREDTSRSEDSKEYESTQSGSSDFVGEVNTSQTRTTGGSVTRKADKETYDISSSGEFESAIGKVLTDAGFEVVEAEYVVEESEGLLSVEDFKEDFRHGDDISGATRRNAVKGLRKVGIPYMAIGTLDVGLRDKDPATGLVRVYVTVTGKVLSLKKSFPKTVAAVGPVVYAGLGPDQKVARANALKLAAESAASTLTQQMNSKGIH
jgi:hypothetical protein